MKIAFVHCRIMPGGALNVFKDLVREEQYQTAEVFTLISDRTELKNGRKNLNVITALPKWVNQIFLFFKNKNIPILSSLFDYRNLIVLYPLFMKILSRKIKKFAPDKIIISSFAIAKNLDQCLANTQGPYVKLYMHSPMQYIREHYDEYTQKVGGFKLWLFKILVPYLRKRDKKYTRYDKVLFNSHYTLGLANKLYGLKGTIKYPTISPEFYESKVDSNPLSYYVYVGRLVRFSKECDKIIELFNNIEESLLVIGDGPDENYLKQQAKGNIIFLGWVKDSKERIEIMRKAKGLINITKESFGIVTAESLLLGVPIFGYNKGSTPELVDEKSGYLVEQKDIKTLKKGFNEFKNMNFDRQYISNTIRKKLKE